LDFARKGRRIVHFSRDYARILRVDPGRCFRSIFTIFTLGCKKRVYVRTSAYGRNPSRDMIENTDNIPHSKRAVARAPNECSARVIRFAA